MKRAKETPRVVRRVYPLLFWMTCHKCKQEFRREYGWHYPDQSRPGFNGGNPPFNNAYFCSECFPTHEAVEKYVREWRPPPPPQRVPPAPTPTIEEFQRTISEHGPDFRVYDVLTPSRESLGYRLEDCTLHKCCPCCGGTGIEKESS